MRYSFVRCISCLVVIALFSPLLTAQEKIKHSYLVLGGKTAIIDENDQVVWEYAGGSRDGFVLPNGNVLLAYSNRVEEVDRMGKLIWKYSLDPINREIGTAQRLYNGNTLITELGAKPRLLEFDSEAQVIRNEFPLQPETDNAHMQTRMARQLRSGNFLVPHLLAFAVKEYTPSGEIVRTFKTDLESIGGRPAENWPFTAIRLDNGNTLISLTHGNKVIEINQAGEIVWQVNNQDVNGLFKDPCGCQRLANGHTVVGSHAANQGISMVEVNVDKKIVWTSEHPYAAGVHHFQILTTNGKPEPGMPLK